MAYNNKKLVLGVFGGLLIAILIITSFVWMGFLPTSETTGRLVVKIKDAPASLEELNITIDAVEVHREGGGNETWYGVDVVKTEPFDLLGLTDFSIVLAVDDLLVGNYTEVRFHIADANATIDGVSTPLSITTEWVMVKVHFKIQKTPVTTVTLDVNVQAEPILNDKILMPVAIATVEYSG